MTNEDQSDITRARISEVAVQTMAKTGIHGVSLRSINATAGCRNASAVHYHFGGRMPLIEAALKHVFDPLFVRRGALLDSLASRMDTGGEVTVRAVLEAACLPFQTLVLDPAYGPDACRFVARVMQEADEELQEILNRLHAPQMAQLAQLLHRLLPEIPIPVLLFRMLIFPPLIVYTTIDARVLYNSPFGNMAPEPPVEIFRQFLDFAEGGLTAPCGETDLQLADRIEAMLGIKPPK